MPVRRAFSDQNENEVCRAKSDGERLRAQPDQLLPPRLPPKASPSPSENPHPTRPPSAPKPSSSSETGGPKMSEPELPLHPLAPPNAPIAPQPANPNDLRPSNVAVIREVYDGENYLVKFEIELEHALEAGCAVIVIEPERLAEVTRRWITVGNALHKIAVGTGLVSIITGVACKPLVCAPFGIASLLCVSCYTLSWQTDPCCKYQKESNPKRYLPVLADLTSATPLVLVRTDNTKKIAFHCSVSIAAALVCLWRVYKMVK